MKVLMISEMFPPTYNAEGLVAARVVKYLLAEGHDVRIIARPANHKETAFLPDDKLLEKCITFVPLRRSPLFKGRLGMMAAVIKTGLWEYSARWVPDALKAARDLVRSWRPDLISSRSEPFSAHLVAYRISQQYKIPWVASFGDPWPRSDYPPPYQLTKNPITVMHWKRWQHRVLNRCGMCIFPTDQIRNMMVQSAGIEDSDKAIVIPHIAPERSRHGDLDQPKKLTILHAGSIPDERYPVGLASGVALLVRRNPDVRRDVRFHFVGPTSEKLRRSFHENAIEEMFESRLPVPYKESLDLARKAQILLLVEANMRESIFLPSKFVDYVSTGKPILALAPPKGPVASFLAKGGGKIAPPNDADAISAVLKELYDAWVTGNLEKSFSSHTLYNDFAPETLGPSLLDCFKRAVDRPEFERTK